MLSEMIDRLKTPTGSMSWLQLGAATVFVIVVALMWRQVMLMLMKEI